MDLYNLDCFDFFKKYSKNININNKINLCVLDLPYGQTQCEWDVLIDLSKMWKYLDLICHPSCIFIFFCTTKFGVSLINSRPDYFRYDMVWSKNNSVGFLSSKKRPLRKHEMIYVFGNTKNNDYDRCYNLELREYSKKLFNILDITSSKDLKNIFGHSGFHHFFSYKAQQFSLPTEKNYNELIELYNIDELDFFISYDDMKKKFISISARTYNIHKFEGKPYKVIYRSKKLGLYGFKTKPENNDISYTNTGRYPSSILEFKSDNSNSSFHPTQKPVALLEWLIKTYSNPKEIVMDFCMGSGSTGVACVNTDRKFIGVEKDKKFFDIAKKRIYKNQS